MLKQFQSDFMSISLPQKIWLITGLLIMLVVSTLINSPLLPVFASLVSVVYVVAAQNDKKSALYFGILSVLSYGYLAFQSKVYGDFVQNIFWQFPVLLLGIKNYVSNESNRTPIVDKANIIKNVLLYLLAVTVFAGILKLTGDPVYILDSFTTITSVVAVRLLATRSRYQFVLWTLVNGASIIIWVNLHGFNTLAVMWSFYFCNGIIGLYKDMNYLWKREHTKEL